MDIQLDNGKAAFQIQGYQDNCIKVNNQTYNSALFIMPNLLITPWEPESLDDLKTDDLDKLLTYPFQLLIIGTGLKHQFLKPELYKYMEDRKMGLEVMNTPAACRTYTVLMAEGRQVAACLFNDINNNSN